MPLGPNPAEITGGTITGITDLAIADGGTGASTAATALTALGGIGAATTDTLTNKTLSSATTGSTVAIGTGTGVATFVGVANVNTTSQATTGTVKETLASYTLLANSLSGNGKAVRITVWFVTAANSNSKTFTIDFGGTSVATRTTTAGADAHVALLEAIVVRTGANAQTYVSRDAVRTQTVGFASGLGSGTLAITDTAAITIAATATTPTAAGDVTFKGLVVEFLN